MSWKSLVTAGLFCVLASPAFAAPNMGIVKGGSVSTGNLDANGNWVWTVQVTPDTSVGQVGDATGTPVAMEAGFASTTIGGAVAGQGNILSVARNPAGGTGSFDTLNPGTAIFGTWQNTTNGLIDVNSNNRPTGIQVNAPGVGTNAGASYTTNSSFPGTANEVFAALGSVNFTTSTAKNVMDLTVQGPVIANGSAPDSVATTTIKIKGVYGVGSTNARLTQINGLVSGTYTTSNYDTFGGNSYSFTRQAKAGDLDLDGDIDFDDFTTFFGQYPLAAGAQKWSDGDFNGNKDVDFDDFTLFFGNFGPSHNYNVGIINPGSGAGLGGANVPEPASIALLGLAMLGGLGIRRKR